MALSPVARRVGVLALGVAVIVAIALQALYLRGQHKAAAAESVRALRNAPVAPPPISETIHGEPQPPATEPEFDPKDAASFATLADAGVAELRDGISLEQWKNSQKDFHDWQPSKDESFFDCRTLVKTETLASGRQVKHFVYFYPPEPPTPAVFPAGSADGLLNHDCRFSMVRVQTAANTDRDGHFFEQTLQQQFVKKYGESIGMKDTMYDRSMDAAHWIPGSEIISGYDPHPRPSGDEDPDAPTGGIVSVFARMPIVRKIERDACCRMADHYHAIEVEQFHQALAIAAADDSLAQRLATLFQQLLHRMDESPSDEAVEARESVLPTLREWLNAIKPLPPVRHAAGLYVADRLLTAATDGGWGDLIEKERTELRSTFEKLGATFEYEELGASYAYSGSWLDQARELDPEGTVGQMSVLVSLARGGSPKLPKDKGEELDIFHTVISDGEWLLSKQPNAATAAQIHFIIGDAEATILALAGGAETEYGDPKKYQPEAPAAQHEALEHYRAGLAIDGTSDNAKMAWLQAWKISAGLLPITRWVYIYD